MGPNPVLRKLGFADDDRVVIIHADDIGMCQATLTAFDELIGFGLVSCGAVMVPCPWFPQVAAYCRQHPDVDLGAHLTLTSEWEGYRWGPISTRDPASGLLDDEGYFHHRSEEVQEHVDAAAAQRELEAQVARALAAGLDLTHVDTHMGTVAHSKFVPVYVPLALQHRLPLLMFRFDEAGWRAIGLDGETAALAVQLVQQLEAQGVPLLDNLVALPLEAQPGDRVALAKEALGSLPPGLTHFIIHPAQDTPELRAITSSWQSRVADYQAFTSRELADYIKSEGLQVIGYRPLRELMRDNAV
jgi:predicted glycoside hydrolase/deacetylase ChbG (UPF0249 family)